MSEKQDGQENQPEVSRSIVHILTKQEYFETLALMYDKATHVIFSEAMGGHIYMQPQDGSEPISEDNLPSSGLVPLCPNVSVAFSKGQFCDALSVLTGMIGDNRVSIRGENNTDMAVVYDELEGNAGFIVTGTELESEDVTIEGGITLPDNFFYQP